MIQKQLVFTILLSVVVTHAAGSATELSVKTEDYIMERYRSLLLSEESPEGDTVQRYADQISESGTWQDINYKDGSRAGWQPLKHIRRVRLMALAVAAEEHNQNENEALHRAIGLALDHWNAKRYRAGNWWFNQIGVPRAMRDIVALLGNDLKGERRKAAIEVIGQHKLEGTGANLMWSAELSLHHGCLTGNREQIVRAAQRIWEEIKTGAGEGIQRDWSFHQHGKRLQTFHYGRSYLDVVCKIAWQLRETPWSIPEDKRTIISNYILEGAQWMCRGTYTVPGTLDRAVSRKGNFRFADLLPLLGIWREVDPENRERLDAFIARQEGNGSPLVGYRHFPQSDFTVYHRPAASVFLKTVSSRTHFTESINSENQKGVPYLHCGDHYILRDGPEYHELQPVWQWKYLPGLSMSPENLKQERTHFVGGVGNGQSGLTAMDYVRKGEDGAVLSIRKTWFFHDDVIICLMGGMEIANVQGPVVSALEQCRLSGTVEARINDAKVMELAPGNHDFGAVRWLLHNKIGYVPLNMAGVKVFVGEREGTWGSINRSYNNDNVQEPVFHILLDHGKDPKSQGWAVVLGATGQEMDAIVNKPVWEILRNDRDCQSIRFADGLYMASFYGPGSTGRAGEEIIVDQPCLAMWSEDRLWMSDPTMKGRDIYVNWRGRKLSVKLPIEGKVKLIAPADTDKPRR